VPPLPASKCDSDEAKPHAAPADAEVKVFLGLLRNLLLTHEVKLVLDLLAFAENVDLGTHLGTELRSFVQEKRISRMSRSGPDPLAAVEGAASDIAKLHQEARHFNGGTIASASTSQGTFSGPAFSIAQSSIQLSVDGNAATQAQNRVLTKSSFVVSNSEQSEDDSCTIDEILSPSNLPGMARQESPGTLAMLSLCEAVPSTSSSRSWRDHKEGSMDGAYAPMVLHGTLRQELETTRQSYTSSEHAQPSRTSSPHGSVASKVGRTLKRVGLHLPQPHAGAAMPGYEGYERTSHDDRDSGRRSTLDEEALRHHLNYGSLVFDDLSEDQIAWLALPSDRWVLHPNQLACLLWQGLALIAILMESIVLPVDLAFRTSMPQTWYLWFTAFFSLDILINLNTGYFHESKLIMHRRFFTKKYLRTWFLVDLISTVPWEFVLSGGTVGSSASSRGLFELRLANFMRGLRLLRLTKSVSKVQRLEAAYFCALRRFQLRILITKIVIILGIVCHWSACVWGIIGDAKLIGHPVADDPSYMIGTCTMGGPCENGVEGSPWRHRYGLNNYSQWTQYLVAMQYATALVFGGDVPVTPGTSQERIFATIMMVVGAFTCSIIVGEVLMVLTRQREQTLAFDEKMGNVHNFMSMRLVPLELQAKIRRYLEHTFQVQHSLAQDNREFMQSLSPWLRVELLEFLHHNVLTQHKFFQRIPHQAVRHLCMEAMPVLYAPGDLVTEKGHIAQSASFVVRGKLRVANAVGFKSVYLTPPSWIGDRCLFVDAVRSHTINAVVHTETLNVSKVCVEELCDAFPQMREIHSAFRAALLQGDESVMRCVICNGLGHSDVNCPEALKAAEAAEEATQSEVRSDPSMPKRILSAWRSARQKHSRTADRELSHIGP